MAHRIWIAGLALILGISLPASPAGAVQVAELEQRWEFTALLEASAPLVCPATLLASITAEELPAPVFLISEEEEASPCRCCALTGHKDCCNPCFQ